MQRLETLLQPILEHELFKQPLFKQPLLEQPLFKQPLFKQPLFKQELFNTELLTPLSGGIPVYSSNKLLLNAARRLEATPISRLFEQDAVRAERYSVEAAGLFFDYSKNRIDFESLSHLLALAEEADLQGAVQRLYQGELVNNTELQPALHTALRDFSSQPAAGAEIQHMVMAARDQMYRLAEQVRAGEWLGHTGKAVKHVVVLGIGGSYLGPKLVCEALKSYQDSDLSIDFVASLDPAELFDVLEQRELEKTLFVVSSKSFGTVETISNATVVKELLQSTYGSEQAINRHMVAVTANEARALEFGFDKANILPLWAWVGGRYSLWSSIGLPIVLAIGPKGFDDLLKGAWEMDCHFRSAPLRQNLPVLQAMIGIWNRNYLNAESHAVLPYSHRLRSLPEYLQQLEMESNGKSVTKQGKPVTWATCPLVWGGMGNLGQHAYYQLMHQGTDTLPADFIVTRSSEVGSEEGRGLQNSLLSNAIGQAQALMEGRSLSTVRQNLFAGGHAAQEIRSVESHQVVDGDRPTNTLLMDELTPKSLGALLALYEAKVYCQSVIWQINAFDQWSVELGKTLSKEVLPAISGDNRKFAGDASTRQLINRCKTISGQCHSRESGNPQSDVSPPSMISPKS